MMMRTWGRLGKLKVKKIVVFVLELALIYVILV